MFIAQRATYTGRALWITIMTRIFDVMIQPIVTYGSEVWGIVFGKTDKQTTQ